MKLRLLFSSLILFLIAIGFNALFNLKSFDKLYIESNVSRYRVIAKGLTRRIETGIRYGKKLETFSGMGRLLGQAKKDIMEKISLRLKTGVSEGNALHYNDIFISVAGTDGTILHSDNPALVGTRLPKAVLMKKGDTPQTKTSRPPASYVKYMDTYVTTLPIRSPRGKSLGTLSISFQEKQIKSFLESVFKKNVQPIVIMSLFGILMMMLFMYFHIPVESGSHKISKKKFYLVTFLIISSVQFFTSGLSMHEFKKQFFLVNREKSKIISGMVKRDIEYLLAKGVRIDRMVKLDKYLGEIINDTPELKDINISDRNGQPLYRATKTRNTDFQNSKNAYPEWLEATKPISNPDYQVKLGLATKDRIMGYVSSNASKEVLFKKLIKTSAGSITVIVISILFFVELLILIFNYIERKTDPSDQVFPVHYGVMRPAAFLLLFGIDISISFLPLHMEKLYLPTIGLSRDTVMGLPISVEFMFVGISILVAGVWLDRRGWHEPFLVGLVLAVMGVLYSWLAPDAIQFIVSRALVGLGYGLSLMASQGFVITYSDHNSKAQGLAQLFAGIYAGSICGGATGAMLAEWIGFGPVFLIGAAILASVILYTFLFMRNAMKKPEMGIAEEPLPDIRKKPITNFVFNRTVLALILFSSLPAAIAVVGFLNYFSPIYLNRLGVSQSTIGQIMMIYGISLIYIAPFISRYVDASRNKKLYVFLGCALGSISLLIFYVLDGIIAAVVAVLLLGISSSFVLASQSAFALKLKVTRELGEGKAIGIFRSTSRVGQMLGPIVFSSIIVAFNIHQGIAYLGLAYLATAFLFILLIKRDRKTVVLEDV